HAHIASCMFENKISDKVIGVSFDGTGYGDDGALWGSEFLICDYKNYQRIAHLKYIPLLGQEQAIKEPWRLTATWLDKIFGDKFLKLDIGFTRNLDKSKWEILSKLLSAKNLVLTSSMGRLFDAIAGLVGIREAINYEAQASIELEMAIKNFIKISKNYEYKIIEKNEQFIIEPEDIFRGIIDDIRNKKTNNFISQKFHQTIASLANDMCCKIREKYGLSKVALSGGVFQNMVLLELTYNLLKKNSFKILLHSQVPCNDGGISLGQAVIANERLE
ncbi:MAG: carbamoyltransferase HypF, partial [Candidatus Omnitrophota bacterium]